MTEIDRDTLVAQIKAQAMSVLLFTYSDPKLDVPEPRDMDELGSFAVVQLLLVLEDTYDVVLMEDMGSFVGRTFEELADFILERMKTSAVE